MTLTGVLGVALLASIGLNIWARSPGTRTRLNVEYFPDMARTARYNAFEENPNFADGMTLRPPVPGTIPRGLPPLSFGGEAPASAPLENPFAADDRSAVERGAAVFANFCQPCHGPSGQGDGLVPRHGFPAPPPLSRGQTQGKTDEQFFQILTNGQNTMPSYASQISREDRWRAILYVRTLRRASQDAEPGAK
jgi:mono/diheme cytochrome c family protein